jgi:hypothetical protein
MPRMQTRHGQEPGSQVEDFVALVVVQTHVVCRKIRVRSLTIYRLFFTRSSSIIAIASIEHGIDRDQYKLN